MTKERQDIVILSAIKNKFSVEKFEQLHGIYYALIYRPKSHMYMNLRCDMLDLAKDIMWG